MHPNNDPYGSKYGVFGECATTARCSTNPNKEIRIVAKVMLGIEKGKVFGVRWDVFGDPVAMATASWCSQKSRGKSVVELLGALTMKCVVEELEITDYHNNNVNCHTTITAFRNALNNYK